MRMGSEGSRLVREWASWRREPQIPGGLVSFSSLVFCGLAREKGEVRRFHTVVLCVVVGLLDGISPTYGGSVVV